MTATIFVMMLGIALAGFLVWGFRVLPGERWQIIAAVPVIRDGDGRWRGVNFTYYGFFSATGYLAAVMILFILLGALHIPVAATLIMVCVVLAVCAPASSVVARIVEGKRHTFSVAGAFFVGLIVVPFVIYGMNVLLDKSMQVPLLPAFAAIGVAYAFGEGLGRLGCISFGCCYGKRLSDMPLWVQRAFARWSFVFLGDTKKIAYASGMAGDRIFPVQGITAVLYVGSSLLGVMWFLQSRYLAAFLLAMIVTQSWRVYSETLRADYRGDGGISAYQIMAFIALVYAAAFGVIYNGEPSPSADLLAGLKTLWHPAMLLFLQSLWLVVFIYTGRSSVTEAVVAFHVCRDKI